MHAIIQARLTSERLPGKMLKPLHGKPLLQWVVLRLQKARTLEGIVIATSDQPEDDGIERFARTAGVECYRGSLKDVRSRFAGIVSQHHLPAFVRISGDSPMIDPELFDQAVTLYNDGDFDLVTNVRKRTFPKGQSVEILRSSTFLKTTRLDSDADDREHVTLHFYRNPSEYRIHNFESGGDHGKVQLSVDTQSDFDRMERLMDSCDPETANWLELVKTAQQLEL